MFKKETGNGFEEYGPNDLMDKGLKAHWNIGKSIMVVKACKSEKHRKWRQRYQQRLGRLLEDDGEEALLCPVACLLLRRWTREEGLFCTRNQVAVSAMVWKRSFTLPCPIHSTTLFFRSHKNLISTISLARLCLWIIWGCKIHGLMWFSLGIVRLEISVRILSGKGLISMRFQSWLKKILMAKRWLLRILQDSSYPLFCFVIMDLQDSLSCLLAGNFAKVVSTSKCGNHTEEASYCF